uniref:Transcriptional regulator, SARP family n=1 Tax=Amycolatopsis sp. FU40 TaxID=2914159 RepID=G4XIL1_9PSEU|nr:transcriptional regulator, SARP family [Amycolatopsis sp. FU40]
MRGRVELALVGLVEEPVSHPPYEFGVLGPLELRAHGTPVPVNAPTQRVVLAALLLRANKVVTLGELTEIVWGASVPAQPTTALRVYIMRLRRLLGRSEIIRTTPTGYLLEVPDDALDLYRFRDLTVRAGRQAADGELARAVQLWDEALALWRDEPLLNVPSDSLRRSETPQLVEARLRAECERAEAKLRLGEHQDVVSHLRRLTAEYPLREQLWHQLMLALHGVGRQAEALSAYRTIVDALAENLGTEPGPELQNLFHAILNDDLDLKAPAVEAVQAPRPPRPASAPGVSQLPPALEVFVGRTAELQRIGGLLETAGDGSVPVVTVSGPPGVGKTALAVRLAHQLRSRFPDGQLYVDLRGYSDKPALSTPSVLARLMRALGLPAERTPVEEEEQVTAYRALLAGKRVLVMLDNAASAAQIRPLIPGDAGCAVLVTSRSELRSLVALDGAHLVRLDLFEREASVALLGTLLGEQVAHEQRDAIARLADLCGHLPLALRIAGGNLAGRPRPDINAYNRSFEEGYWAHALTVETEEDIAVHQAFGLSYAGLKPEVQTMFRLLALAPGADFAADAAAVLAELPRADAMRTLEQLAEASLLHRLPGERYHMHDLLREYAAQCGESDDDPEYLERARARLRDWHLRTAELAVRTLYGELPRYTRAQPPARATPDGISRADALRWLDAERAALIALVEHCAEHGPREVAWQLTEILDSYLSVNGHQVDLLAAAATGLRAAREAGDASAETAMLIPLIRECQLAGDLAKADRYLAEALDEAKADTPGRPMVLVLDGGIRLDLDELDAARERFRQVAELAKGRQVPPIVRLKALLGLGYVQLLHGEFASVQPLLSSARKLAERIGATIELVESLLLLGHSRLALGQPGPAAEYLLEAVDRAKASGTRHHHVESLGQLAIALLAAGDPAKAAAIGERALASAAKLGNPRTTANAWNVVGTVRLWRGEFNEAVQAYENALEHSTGGTVHRYGMLEALLGLARAHGEAARPRTAFSHARFALTGARDSGYRYHEGLARGILLQHSGGTVPQTFS